MKYPAICFTIGNEYKFVYPADIIKILSSGSYSEVYIQKDKKFTISKNLKEIEEVLPDDLFMRVHNSAIINLVYVASFHQENLNQIELIDGSLVALSRRRKAEFLSKFIKL